MKEALLFIISLVAVFTMVHIQEKKQGVWVNCSISEISPDFTPEMRELCRQYRRNYASGINK